MSYPTAYRSGSARYAGTPAFRGAPAVSAAYAGAMGAGGGLGFGYSGPNFSWPSLPRPSMPSIPPGARQAASTAFAGVSRGALTMGAQALRFMPAVRWLALAAPFFLKQDMVQQGPVVGLGWRKCFGPEACPGYELGNYVGQVGRTGGTDLLCATSFCANTVGMPQPQPEPNLMYGYHQWANHPGEYINSSLYYAATAEVEVKPPAIWWFPDRIPIRYPGVPQLLPIAQPVQSVSVPIRYADRASRIEDEYRVTGPTSLARAGSPASVAVMTDPLTGREIVARLVAKHEPPPKKTKEKKKRYRRVLAVINAVTEADDLLECFWKALPRQLTQKSPDWLTGVIRNDPALGKNKVARPGSIAELAGPQRMIDSGKEPVLGRKIGKTGQTLYYWTYNWAKWKGYSDAQIKAHNALFKSKDARPVHQTVPHMVEDLLSILPLMDEAEYSKWFNKAAICARDNVIQDALIGFLNREARQALERFQKKTMGRTEWMHLGTGPAM